MKLHSMILSALVTVLFFGCTNQEPEPTSSDPVQEVKDEWENYIKAMKSVNVDSVLAFWAEDLKLIMIGDDINGKEALRNLLEPIYDNLEIHEINVTSMKMESSGDIVVDVSEYSETVSMGGAEKIITTGKQLTVWKKIDGSWKISIVCIIPTSSDPIHDVF